MVLDHDWIHVPAAPCCATAIGSLELGATRSAAALLRRGVIDYTTDYSGAVPAAAANDPFTMTGWVNQDVKGWRWQLVNGYNSTVVDFVWAFKANTQGQYRGGGAFLNHVTTVVADIYAAWGFQVSVKAHADEPYNAGTLGAPIAVQELQVAPPKYQQQTNNPHFTTRLPDELIPRGCFICPESRLLWMRDAPSI